MIGKSIIFLVEIGCGQISILVVKSGSNWDINLYLGVGGNRKAIEFETQIKI